MNLPVTLSHHQLLDRIEACRNLQEVPAADAVAIALSTAWLNAAPAELLDPAALHTAMGAFEQHFGSTTSMRQLPPHALTGWMTTGTLQARHERRAVLSIVCLPLMKAGLLEHNLASGLALAPLDSREHPSWGQLRPLLPLELVATRLACSVQRGAMPRTAMYAVVEAGACTGELAPVRGEHFDSPEATSLTMQGHAKVSARTLELSGWRQLVNATYLQDLFDDEPLDGTRVFYGGRKAATAAAAQASVCSSLGSLLSLAGFGDDVNVKPHSIRNGATLAGLRDRTDDVERIVLAMRRLGLNYDSAAKAVGLERAR